MTTIIGEVLDTIRDFAEPLTVTRPNREQVTDGYVTPTTISVAGVTGHMQPMSDKERRDMPEGTNTLEWWNIWTLAAIQIGDVITDASGVPPSVTVKKLKPWKEGPFWHGQGVIVDDTTALPALMIFTPDFSPVFY